METSYSLERGNRNFKWPLFIGFILVVVALAGYLAFGLSRKFISPLPDEPAMEIIFYTPTPEPVTPSASPSATSKSASNPTPTRKPTLAPTTAVNASPTVTSSQ